MIISDFCMYLPELVLFRTTRHQFHNCDSIYEKITYVGKQNFALKPKNGRNIKISGAESTSEERYFGM